MHSHPHTKPQTLGCKILNTYRRKRAEVWRLQTTEENTPPQDVRYQKGQVMKSKILIEKMDNNLLDSKTGKK